MQFLYLKKKIYMPQYLVWFGHNNSYFSHRFRELESVAHIHGVALKGLYEGKRPIALDSEPYAIVNLPGEEIAKSICKQCVLVKFLIELWGSGVTDELVLANVRSQVDSQTWKAVFSGLTFSYKVSAYGAQYSEKKRRSRMDAFASLFCNDEKVDLKDPGIILHIIDVYSHGCEITGTRDESSSPSKLFCTFYGRQVGDVNTGEDRNEYVLTERPILGPTSLDNDLAFLMANMAEIKSGSFVFDPFCGTGGLLVTATARGATVVGTDIDTRVLRGDYISYVRNAISENMSKDIFQNFVHYGLNFPEVFAADNSHPFWRRESVFDAILTDPPYGVRAGAKRIGSTTIHEICNRDTYYPQMVPYAPSDVVDDLLHVASRVLVNSGTLVYFLHVELIDLFTAEELEALPKNAAPSRTKLRTTSGKTHLYANECARDDPFLNEAKIVERVVPMHPDFTFASAVLQILSAGTGRILVKMKRNTRHE